MFGFTDHFTLGYQPVTLYSFLPDRMTEPASVNPVEFTCYAVNEQAYKLERLLAEVARQCQIIQEHSAALTEVDQLLHNLVVLRCDSSALSAGLHPPQAMAQLTLPSPEPLLALPKKWNGSDAKYDVILPALDMFSCFSIVLHH